MKSVVLISALTLISVQNFKSQEKPKEWDVSMYGFVRTDYIFDSRQSAYVREYNLNLYPTDIKPDANGKDINATGASNFLSITSRLGVKVKGPDVWGAKINGTIEGDFFGNTEISSSASGSGSIGLFRLRHAYVTMTWPKTTLVMGQTWYPSFIPEVYPGVINFNTGILFNPFGWSTQLKVKQKLNENLTLDLAAYKDREFSSISVSGTTTNAPSYNSILPTLHAQLQYKSKKVIAGIGTEYRSLQPNISYTDATGKVYATTEKVNSTAFLGYFKYSDDNIVAKAYGITGGNLTNFVMLGGYVGYINNGLESYKPTKTSAFWIDIASNKQKIAPGIFFGYTKNNGADVDASTVTKYYMRGISGNRGIDDVWRISGRVDFKQNKFKISPEIEYTNAKWGNVDNSASVINSAHNFHNWRMMATATYFF